MNCHANCPKTRVFHIFLKCGAEYEAVGRVEIVGAASARDALELYGGGVTGGNFPTDWYKGEFIGQSRYHYLIQEEGTETITPLTVEPACAYTISGE